MTHHGQSSERPLQTICASASMAEAARMMCQQGVSALVIIDPSQGTPLFTITDRDLVCLTARGLDPNSTTIHQFMGNPCICKPSESWIG